MTAPRLDWLLPEPFLDPPTFEGFGRPVATLLARRGFRDDTGLRAFLEAGTGALHDLSRMADADRALDRIDAAIAAGQRIAIWGDYDADGMSAIAVWVLALRALGVEPDRYVPSRIADGYGLSTAGLDELKARGVDLVITCDCGVVNVAEVAHANGIGLDVIVTDHHLPGPILPPAVAVVDPHRLDCAYPDPDLTGAGLAFKLAAALLARRGRSVPDLAAVAAIGTVSDMAPMTGESRAIVRLGLAELAITERAGLRALLARGAEHPAAPTGRDLGFGIVPRINAAGRIAEAELAISLLVEEDPVAAERIAAALEAVHLQRREMTVAAVAEAHAIVAGSVGEGPLVVRSDGWAPGLIGLIASRLVDALGRPVAVAALVGAEVRGSVRAPVDFHVAAALEATSEHLTKRGGHAGAGGFSAAPEAWERFVAAFQALPRPWPATEADVPAIPAGRVVIDLVLPAAHLGWELADELDRLAPYGPGHVEPMLAVTGLRLAEARRVGASGQHLALRMRRGLEVVDAIAFGVGPEAPLPEVGEAVDLVGTLERDAFQGLPRLRIRVIDYADGAHSPLRGRRLAAVGPGVPAGATA
ncbi:MAG: single-stranded-DNA-specific exonuclease RecJ [Chloroflexota bacterium]